MEVFNCQNWGKKRLSKNHQIFIVGFQVVATNIEWWLKNCTSCLVYSQIWLKLAMDNHPLFLPIDNMLKPFVKTWWFQKKILIVWWLWVFFFYPLQAKAIMYVALAFFFFDHQDAKIHPPKKTPHWYELVGNY